MKLRGEEEAETFTVMELFSPVLIFYDGALLSQEWLKTFLPVGSSGSIPCSALLARVSCCFTFFELVYLYPQTFSLLLF